MITRQAEKDIKKLNKKQKEKLKKMLIEIIGDNPYQGKKLLGDLKGSYSYRMGYKDRIVYSVDEENKIVNHLVEIDITVLEQFDKIIKESTKGQILDIHDLLTIHLKDKKYNPRLFSKEAIKLAKETIAKFNDEELTILRWNLFDYQWDM